MDLDGGCFLNSLSSNFEAREEDSQAPFLARDEGKYKGHNKEPIC